MAFVINALIDLCGIVVLGIALLHVVLGFVVLVIARKGDLPVEFTPRQVGACAIWIGALMAWQSIVALLDSIRL